MPNSRRGLVFQRSVLTDAEVKERIRNLASQITASMVESACISLVGIRTRGVPLAWRLAKEIEARTGSSVDVGELDITLYRDDVFEGLALPEVGVTDLPFSVDGRRILLVDDVFFTGRTVRAALDALMDFGRPRSLELAVLVDRGHRELPIRPDFVGLALDTDLKESVSVTLAEVDGEDGVVVFKKEESGA